MLFWYFVLKQQASRKGEIKEENLTILQIIDHIYVELLVQSFQLEVYLTLRCICSLATASPTKLQRTQHEQKWIPLEKVSKKIIIGFSIFHHRRSSHSTGTKKTSMQCKHTLNEK